MKSFVAIKKKMLWPIYNLFCLFYIYLEFTRSSQYERLLQKKIPPSSLYYYYFVRFGTSSVIKPVKRTGFLFKRKKVIVTIAVAFFFLRYCFRKKKVQRHELYLVIIHVLFNIYKGDNCLLSWGP